MQILPAGTAAPQFTLPSAPDATVSLLDYPARPVILAFYPADFSPVCGDELTLFNEVLDAFGAFDAQLVGISVDGVFCHAAFAAERGLRYPLLADFEPKGAVARRYGVYDEVHGTADRALFVIDGDGLIRWSYLSPLDVDPGANGILDALERLGSTKKDELSMDDLLIPVTGDDHVQGSDTAAVTLVEYGDYQCPYCAAAHPEVKRLQHVFGDRLLLVFRNFPLTQAHPLAQPAAEIAEAAGVLDRFWPMHDWLFENQETWVRGGVDALVAGAIGQGLDADALARGLEDPAIATRIRADFTGGVRSGVNGTPCFFLDGDRIDGGAAALEDAIADRLRES